MSRLFAQLQRKKVSRFIALFICVWMSGAACLLSCGAMEVRAALAETHEHEALQLIEESCPLHTHDCCDGKTETKEDENAVSLSAFRRQTPSLDCCSPLHFVQTNVAPNAGQVDAPVLTAVAPIKPTLPVFERRRVSFQKTYQTIPLNRGSTHLRNCVFLI